MSRSYIYTLASMPALKLEDKIPFDRESFLLMCETTLEDRDYRKLLNTSLGIPDDEESLSGIPLDYWLWEKALRNALVKIRAKEMNIEGSSFLRDEELRTDVEDLALAAVRQETPLDAELFLAARRWEYIDSLRNIEYFSFDNLQVWYLQFQILERLNQFDKEEGFRRYGAIYSDILESQESGLVNNEVKQ